MRVETPVRTPYGRTDWFRMEEGETRLLTVTLFNLHAEHITQNARLHELQAGIKTARRNIDNLRYTDTTLTAESEKELKSLLMRMKEESEKAGLKLSIHKTKIMPSGPDGHHITANRRGKSESTEDFYFLWPPNHSGW